MGLLWNTTKTVTPIIEGRGIRSVHRYHTHYNMKLTWLGTIVLFPIWFPMFILIGLALLVLVIIKAMRG
jgi:hypothetical protein